MADRLRTIRTAQLATAQKLIGDIVHPVLRECFPDIKTGDFPPDATIEWEQAIHTMLERWLFWNAPELHDDSANECFDEHRAVFEDQKHYVYCGDCGVILIPECRPMP